MAFSSYDLYQDYISWVNTFQGGFIPPSTVFIRQANDISKQMWDEKTQDAENNQKNQDDLAPFSKTKNCIVVSVNQTTGRFEYPDDYGQYSSARIAVYQGKTVGYTDCDTCGAKEMDDEEKYQMIERYLNGIVEHDVKKIDNSKWGSCLSSATKQPTLQKPKITQRNNGFYVAPRLVSVIILDYYTEPVDATFVYTVAPGNPQTGAGDQQIFDAQNSVDFEWGTNLKMEFIWRLAEANGIYTRDQLMAAIATKKVTETK